METAVFTELIPSLPHELGLECMTRLPYTAHRVASQVCKQWCDLLESKDFYYRRKRLGYTHKVACLVQAVQGAGVFQGSKQGNSPCFGITVLDPASQAWERLDPVPGYPNGPPLFCQLASCEGKLVVMGGWDPVSYEQVSHVFVYDFTTRKWRGGKEMPSKRSFFAIGSHSGRVYVVGGKNPPIQSAMKPHILLLTSNLPLPSPNLPFRKRKSLPLAFLNRNTSIHFPRFQNPKFKAFEAVRFDCPVTDVTELEGEDCNLVLETCITRALPPALTLERGIESIKASVVALKSNPPCSSHGVFRFQVAVPPSPKALNWFCSLPESDGVFPRFFLSKETEDASFKNLYLHRTRGVFGLGSAICFEACAPENQKRIRRYLSSDSAHIMTYGFMDINFNKESSSIKHEAGSFCFLIPEVELDEQEEASILVVTLAWDENFCWTFEQAIQSLESSIYQASCCFWPDTESCYSKGIKSTLRNFNLMEGKTFQMACTDALFLDRRDYQADTVQMVSPFS